jgi:hypothetical protein
MKIARSLKRLVAVGLLVCVIASCDSGARPDLARLTAAPQGKNAAAKTNAVRRREVARSPLTAEEAKAALVELLRRNRTAFQRELDPADLAKEPVTASGSGNYRCGRFTLRVNEASYEAFIQYGCIFHYKGTFDFEGGRWVASQPSWDSAALVK